MHECCALELAAYVFKMSALMPLHLDLHCFLTHFAFLNPFVFRICLTPIFNTIDSSTLLSGRVYLRNFEVRFIVLQYGRLYVAMDFAAQATINLNDLSVCWSASNMFCGLVPWLYQYWPDGFMLG